jgi:hypothetical protein
LSPDFDEVAFGGSPAASAMSSRVAKPYRKFTADRNRTREITSEALVPLTNEQRRAGAELARIYR